MPSIKPKGLKEMEGEVAEYQQKMGWTDDRSVPTSLALLHEEAAEVGHAWRENGLEDMTTGVTADGPSRAYQAKPQGVGSELADVVIRLLDTSSRYGLSLPDRAVVHKVAPFVFSDDFMDNIDVMHNLISRASVASCEETGTEGLAMALLEVLAYTYQLARHCGFNMGFEYDRKMAYNHTRPYRHGGRRV
jgi:NTP pyrophosphatase (non-canonical NTP hydrolase)